MTEIVLEFDPGGEGNFGWAIVEPADGPEFVCHGSGLADHTADALNGILEAMPHDAEGRPLPGNRAVSLTLVFITHFPLQYLGQFLHVHFVLDSVISDQFSVPHLQHSVDTGKWHESPVVVSQKDDVSIAGA